MTRSSVLRPILATGSVAVAAFLLCVLRIPWPLHDVAWAEDANVFLRDAVENDPWSVIGYGYAGYLHVVPRLFTAVALSIAPLENYAMTVFFICAVLTALICAAVFRLSTSVVLWLPARLTIALLPVLLPLSAQEVLGNLANLHTLAFWLTLWIVFSRPSSWIGASTWSGIAFLCAITEIQTAVLLILFPFLAGRRDPKRLPAFVALALGGVWQIAVFVTTPRTAADHPLMPLSIPAGWLVNALMPMVNADPGSAGIWLDATGLLVPVILLVPFLAAIAVALVLGSREQKLLTLTLVGLSVALYGVSAVVNASVGLDYAASGLPLSERYLHMRYGVIAGLLLAATVPIAADALRANGRAVGSRLVRISSTVAIIGMVTVFAIAGVRSFSARSLVDSTWSAGVRQADAICTSTSGGQEAVVAVAPDRVLIIDCATWDSFRRR